MPPRISNLVGKTPAAKFRGGAGTPVYSPFDYFPDEYLASNYGQNVKAVIPMNQNYMKGTGTGSKFDAIVDGRRTQTTRDNKYDRYAINRLQPNDTIAITGDDGRIQLASVTGKGQVDPNIFLGNPQAIAAYNQAEGGVGPYANVTLMGSYKPKVIPLDQPFGTSEYRTNALSGNAQTLSYEPIGQPIVPPGEPYNPIYPENIQAKISMKDRPEQFSDTGLYKDSYVNWRESPFQGQSGKSPYFTGEDATYPRETAAELDRIVLDGNNYPSEVVWRRDTTTDEAVPYIREGRLREEILLRDRDPEGYAMFMRNANIPSYVQNNSNKHRRFRLDSEPEYYDNKPWKFASGGYTVYKDNAITEAPNRIPSRQMESPDAATIGINRAMAEGSGRENPLDIYRGDFNEPGLDAIEAVARAGGSGTWVNPTYNTALEDIDTWNRIQRRQTQSQAMEETDKRLRGEYVPDAGSTPLAYSDEGYLVYGEGEQYGAAPSIGDFYDVSPQPQIARLVGEPVRNLQRIPEAGEAPQYQYSNVNEYGVSQGAVLNESAYGPAFPPAYRRPPVYLSDKVVEPQTFDRYATDVTAYGKPIKYLAESIRNPLAFQERLPRGRWSGGGLKGQYEDRSSDSTIDPLNSSYQISMPQGTRFVPMQQDPELIPGTNLTLREDYIEPVVPFERQYKIRETGNVIPGSDPDISDAYLPVVRTVDGEDVGYTPFLAGETREAQAILDSNPELASKYYEGQILNEHLADAVIEIGGRKYPLTPEATTTEYLPSKKQLLSFRRLRAGKRRISNDGDIDYLGAGPSEADLMSIEAESSGRGFDVEDDLLNRYAALAKNSKEVYADPAIEPTDIVGAIAEKQRTLNRINAGIANLEGSYYNGVYFPPSPTANDVFDPQSYGPAQQYENTLKGSILGTRYGGGELPSGVSENPRLLSERGMGTREPSQIRSYNRFMNEDEANRIAQSQLTGRADTEYVNPSDLNFLTTEATPGRVLSINELKQQQQLIAEDIQRAKSAYTGLMSLEPQNEIRIVSAGDNNLASQMQKLGMQVQQRASRPGFIATGSLPVGLPGENIPNLPVRYNQPLEEEIYGTQLGNMLESGQLADRSQALMSRWSRGQRPLVEDALTQEMRPPAISMGQPSYPPIKAIMGSKTRAMQQDVYDMPDDAWLNSPDIDPGMPQQQQVAQQVAPGRRPDPFKGEVPFEQTPLPNYATGEQINVPPERRRNYTPLVVGGGIFGTGLLGNMYQQDQERQRMEQQRMMQQGYQ